MGLDIGSKTVGIAVSDRTLKIASGLTTILRKKIDNDCKSIVDQSKSYKIGLIICGWPLHMNNTISEQCENVRHFCERLSNYMMQADFAKWDERFSTSVVDKIMIAASMSRKKREKAIDKTAAAYILQGAIDFLNHNNITRTAI
jgi:putative Holliday junction resolvase